MNELYRKENCPSGDKAVKLLHQQNIVYQDHVFSDKAEEQHFKEKHNVQTTPQIFLEGQRVGGFEALQEHLGVSDSKKNAQPLYKTYQPIIAVFFVAVLLAWVQDLYLMTFMGYFLALLACLKLMNLESFAQGFLNYDLLAQREKTYAYVYPFLELTVALLFLSASALSFAAILAIVMGSIGGVSVFKAVYIDKKDLNCACVGGETQLPLGAVSFLENLAMLVMGMLILF